jgi:hypothetical protein
MQVSETGVIAYVRDGQGYTWSESEGETLILEEASSTYLFVDISNDAQTVRFGDAVYVNGVLQTHLPINYGFSTLSPNGEFIGLNDSISVNPSSIKISDGTQTIVPDNTNRGWYELTDYSTDGGVKLITRSNRSNYAKRYPFFLVGANGEEQEIEFPYGFVADLSGDGKSVLGRSSACVEFESEFGCTAITNSTGTVEISATVVGGTNFFPTGLNYDASIAVGSFRNYADNDWEGRIWDSANGVRDIVDVLAENGIDISGWSQVQLNDISDSGYYILGEGVNPDGVRHPFLINATPECKTGLY